ncbi:hypothetical protein H9X95_06735 [Micromonospora chalcea]|nr:hypothetical protein [Micromonospora chalcea]
MAITHHLTTARASDAGLTAEQVHLLLLDFGSRAPLLSQKDLSRLSVKIMLSFSPTDEFGEAPEQESDHHGNPASQSGTPSTPHEPGGARASSARGGALSAPSSEPGRGVDVAVLTSHPAEFRAVAQVFLGTRATAASAETGHMVDLFALRARTMLSVHLSCSSERLMPGRAPAVRDIAERFDPPAFFLVGTAKGHRGGRLGDVVVPRWACHYELLDDGECVTRVRRLWTPDHVRTLLSYYGGVSTRFQELASNFRMAAEPSELPAMPEELRPRVVLDSAVACGGPELMNADTLDKLRSRDRRLEALDMESYEFGLRNEPRLWAVFRGVVPQDVARADSAKELFLAAGHAAACLKDFLEHEYLPE